MIVDAIAELLIFIQVGDFMIFYSQKAIEYAVTRCVEKPKYRVLVSIPLSRLKELKRFIKRTKYKQDIGYRITETSDCLTVHFENGSALYTVSTAEHTKGRPVHLAILDDNLSREFIIKVILPIEVLEIRERS